MRRRSRTRRVLKWVGLVGCVLVLAAWAVSSLGYMFGYRGGEVYLAFWFGSVNFGYDEHDDPRGGQFVWRRFHTVGEVPIRDRLFAQLFSHWWPSWEVQETLNPRPPYEPGLLITGWVPLWIFFVLLAIPTAVLWHRDRRPPKGHCQNCGYDLTGNVSGVCPECGEPTADRE